MIKIEIIRTGNSYFKPESEKMYDLTRDNIKRVKIFGITIWEKRNILKDSDVININENKIGFKKCE